MNDVKKENDLISVIIPVYNSEKYIKRCIDSVLGQTYQNYEIILVDDGSTDRSGEICDEYAEQRNFIRVIHQNNKGQAAARNVAIELAKGEWISFVDSDDMIHPQMLEILYNATQKDKVSISICDSIADKRIPVDFFENQEEKIEYLAINEESMRKLFYLEKNYYWIAWAKLIRKEIIQKRIFTEGKIFEDNAVVCQWLYEAKRVAICNNEMYFYCTESESTVRSEFNVKKLDYLWALEQQILFYRVVQYYNMVNIVTKAYMSYADVVFEKLLILDKRMVKEERKSIINFWKKNKLFCYVDKNLKLKYLNLRMPKIFKFLSSQNRKK